MRYKPNKDDRRCDDYEKIYHKRGFTEQSAEIRKEHGLTQQELADKLYVDKRTISRIENGTYLTLENLIRISNVFGVSLDYIMLRCENRKSPPESIDKADGEILAELKNFSPAEKKRLLKHLELDNALKLNNIG